MWVIRSFCVCSPLREFLIQGGVPKRTSERQFAFLVCCELLTKCLIADLEDFIAIYLSE